MMLRMVDGGGGRVRPPSLYDNRGTDRASLSQRARPAMLIGMALFAIALCATPLGGQPGYTHARPQKRRVIRVIRAIVAPRLPAQRPFAPGIATPVAQPRPYAARPVQDKEALELLKKMLRPTAEYTGEQVTELIGRNGRSRQRIEGDVKGRIRRDYIEPAAYANDVMIVGPNAFRYLHYRAQVLDVAFWPTEWDGKEQRLQALIRQGRLIASLDGSDVIAGRNATRVKLTSVVPNGEEGDITLEYWIDPTTGIQLKTEKTTNGGQGNSRSYLTSVTLEPVGTLDTRDFDINPKGLQVNPLFPRGAPEFASMAQAASALPFQPLVPSSLPVGFQLRGVWVFGGAPARARSGAVLLRYTDGIATFSLYERPLPSTAPPNAYSVPPASYQRHIQRWRLQTPTGDVEITYIGDLPQDQAHAIYDSLK